MPKNTSAANKGKICLQDYKLRIFQRRNEFPLWMALACSLPKAVELLFFPENIGLY